MYVPPTCLVHLSNSATRPLEQNETMTPGRTSTLLLFVFASCLGTARPTRPARWRYDAADVGRPMTKTTSTPSKCSPRAEPFRGKV
ncbi:hypothetical protein HJC23_011087, partial [Cyclotella cryptica]